MRVKLARGQVGKVTRGQGVVLGRDEVAPLPDPIEETRGQGEMSGRDAVAPLPETESSSYRFAGCGIILI